MKTVSLELSKELKEAGYPQEGVFIWSDGLKNACHWSTADKLGIVPLCFAPTADEILEQLPEYIDDYFLEICKDSSNSNSKEWWLVRYHDSDAEPEIKYAVNLPSLADAAARMYLYLKKRKTNLTIHTDRE